MDGRRASAVVARTASDDAGLLTRDFGCDGGGCDGCSDWRCDGGMAAEDDEVSCCGERDGGDARAGLGVDSGCDDSGGCGEGACDDVEDSVARFEATAPSVVLSFASLLCDTDEPEVDGRRASAAAARTASSGADLPRDGGCDGGGCGDCSE